MPLGLTETVSKTLNGLTVLLKFFIKGVNCLILVIIFVSRKMGRSNGTVRAIAAFFFFIWLFPKLCSHIGRKFERVEVCEYP